MGKIVATLCLGTRPDATTWNAGCQSLGFTVAESVCKPEPSDAELDSIFACEAEWLYLGGHFGDNTLTNESGSLEIEFTKDSVKICRTGKEDRVLMKGAGFRLHSSCWMTLWGGCSVCSSGQTIRNIQQLFDGPLILGFAGLTGWRMVDAMLGGGFMHKGHFFDNVRGKTEDMVAWRTAWMKAAARGYGDGPNETKFRAVDSDGQEWVLEEGKIVKGRKL